MKPKLPALLLALLLIAPAVSAAGDEAGFINRSASAVADTARSLGAAIASTVGSLTQSDQLPPQLSDDDRRFFAVLETLGLQLAEVNVGKGWLGSVTYRFVPAREPSDVDMDRAERKLTEYQELGGGLRYRAKQKIARSTVDTALTGGFTITAMDIVLWPWPDAGYQLTARNRPPEAGERRVIESAPRK
jgi:hypothetical protein